MIRNFLKSVYGRWQWSPIRAKLLIPIIGLMALSLLVSTSAFMIGTAKTQEQILMMETSAEEERVVGSLMERAERAATAAGMLARDPAIKNSLQMSDEETLHTLNKRAVVVRDRLNLDLIQIYNRVGEARTNLVRSELYQISSLLVLVQVDGIVLREVDGRLLLLGRATLPDNAGTVLAGIDLETELHRVSTAYRLFSELGVSLYHTEVGTKASLPFKAAGGLRGNDYIVRRQIKIGDQQTALILVRPVTDIRKITQAGMNVMIATIIKN